MKIQADKLKKLLRAVVNTNSEELDCGECFEKMDQFIELKLKGKTPEEALPLVEDHLKRCKSCCQECKALLEAIKSIGISV